MPDYKFHGKLLWIKFDCLQALILYMAKSSLPSSVSIAFIAIELDSSPNILVTIISYLLLVRNYPHNLLA